MLWVLDIYLYEHTQSTQILISFKRFWCCHIPIKSCKPFIPLPIYQPEVYTYGNIPDCHRKLICKIRAAIGEFASALLDTCLIDIPTNTDY